MAEKIVRGGCPGFVPLTPPTYVTIAFHHFSQAFPFLGKKKEVTWLNIVLLHEVNGMVRRKTMLNLYFFL